MKTIRVVAAVIRDGDKFSLRPGVMVNIKAGGNFRVERSKPAKRPSRL